MTYLEEKRQHAEWREENNIVTEADVWIKEYKTGKWRIKRKRNQKCDNRWIDENGKRIECGNIIKIGDKYLDTGEYKDVYIPYRYCTDCANRRII